jgi:amino acid adenylation domain-containing protein
MKRREEQLLINVLEYLDYAAQNFPGKTAFSDGVYGLSFAELDRRSRAVGSYLAKAGHRRLPVVVLMGRSPDTIAAFFGAVYAGCAYVPVDPEMARSRIEGIFADLDPAVIIYEDKTRPLLETLAYTGKPCNFAEMIQAPDDDRLLGEIRENAIDADLLYIVYTSGSTGQPKGVAACHRSVIDYIESLSAVLGVSRDTVFGNQTPLYVDACLKELYPTLKYGATTYLIPKELFLFPVKLIDYLNAHKINTICWVASALTIVSGMGALEKNHLQHLHTVAFGSELFPRLQLERWRGALPRARFIHLYGPTECTGMSCWYEIKRDIAPDEPLPIGKPFRNTRVLLFDGDELITQPGRKGEICISGVSLTLGYYNDKARTAAAFRQNPLNKAYSELIYHTGDLGMLNENGELIFCSRRDHQIKHMGHRIELGELENAAAAISGVTQAACVYDQEKNKLVLFFSGTADAAAAMLHLKERLPRFMHPNAVILLPSLPLTPNGKIDRAKLLEIYRERKIR